MECISQKIMKFILFSTMLVFLCGCPMLSSTPVELHIKIKNSSSNTFVIDNELEQETLPIGETTEVIFWKTLTLIFPEGYVREIDCFHNLPEDITRENHYNFLQLKEYMTYYFEIKDEEILYLSTTGEKIYKKQFPVCYDELLFHSSTEDRGSITLKIKNNGKIPIHLTEISSFPPSSEHEFMPDLDEYFKPLLLMPDAEVFLSFPSRELSFDFNFQIKTDCHEQPFLSCRVRRRNAFATKGHSVFP